MPFLALLIGIYSYTIFLLGILHFFNAKFVFFLTLIFFLILISGFYIFNRNNYSYKILKRFFFLESKIKFLVASIMLFVLVNLVGVLGPETAFDATWYHLTIPKIFIQNNQIFFIKGSLFYYSVMPQLSEMLYLASLLISNEIIAKFIHFSFGLMICIMIYKASRIYVDRFYSLLAVIVFYSNLVVSWLSITAFADLTRAFYEFIALFCFLLYSRGQKNYLFLSSIFLGFAMATKLLSILSLPIFLILLILQNKKNKIKLKDFYFYLFICLFISSPWYLFSYINTGNPFFPVFSHLTTKEFYSSFSIFTPLQKLGYFFLNSPDPVSPIYVISLPFIFMNFKKIARKIKILILYCLLSLAILVLTPSSGGGRFVTQFLPAYSVLIAVSIYSMSNTFQKKLLITTIILVSTLNLSYRSIANFKYINTIIGIQSKQDFLMQHLNFSFGDFYDENNAIKKIVRNDKVLLINMHNLFYVNFNFTIPEWNDKSYKYILVQNGRLPKYYKGEMVYKNDKTKVELYKI